MAEPNWQKLFQDSKNELNKLLLKINKIKNNLLKKYWIIFSHYRQKKWILKWNKLPKEAIYIIYEERFFK